MTFAKTLASKRKYTQQNSTVHTSKTVQPMITATTAVPGDEWNATFCKECGAPLNSTSSISTGSDMGELLVSTKTGAAGRKVLLCVLCPLLILLGIFIMATPEAFYELSHQHYRLIAILIGSVLIGYALFCLITTFLGSRSYCDVYENSAVGMTALSIRKQ